MNDVTVYVIMGFLFLVVILLTSYARYIVRYSKKYEEMYTRYKDLHKSYTEVMDTLETIETKGL